MDEKRNALSQLEEEQKAVTERLSKLSKRQSGWFLVPSVG
jgi:hypothetical protein